MSTLLLLHRCRSRAAARHAPRPKTVNILMEGVPDTRLRPGSCCPSSRPETGIDVQIEVVNYAEMHTKLVPQLVAQQGGYDAIVVDFYWVGEFTKAGWLQPLDDRIAADKVDTSVYVPALMNLVGKVDGVTYMLPFYNYAMGLTYRKDMLEDPKNQAAFKAKYGMDLQVPTDLGRVPEAGGLLHQEAEHRTSGAWSTRACGPTRSPWSGRTISSPMAAGTTTSTGTRR